MGLEKYVKENWDELIDYKRQFHPLYTETVDSICKMVIHDETLSRCYSGYNGYYYP